MGSVSLLNKKFFTASFIFFLYILTCQSAFVGRKNDSDIKIGSNETLDPKNLINYREARRSVASGGLFSIVSFDNVPCQATNGDIGVCYTQRECDNLGGISSGICAGNFGVCCVIGITDDGSTVSINNTYFTNPGYPSPVTGPLSICISFAKLTSAVQLYLEFIDFQIRGPSSGVCSNDTFTISIPGVTVQPPTLCGNNVGQSEYVDISQSPGPFQLCVKLGVGDNARLDSAFSALWKIRLLQFKATDSCVAPSGCNQYSQGINGQFLSFNYNGGEGELISENKCITYCVTFNAGFCSLLLSENTFMLPGTAPNDCSGDYLIANGQKFCGDTLGNGLIMVNNTGSAYASFSLCTSDSNPDMDVGFSLNYTQVKC